MTGGVCGRQGSGAWTWLLLSNTDKPVQSGLASEALCLRQHSRPPAAREASGNHVHRFCLKHRETESQRREVTCVGPERRPAVRRARCSLPLPRPSKLGRGRGRPVKRRGISGLRLWLWQKTRGAFSLRPPGPAVTVTQSTRGDSTEEAAGWDVPKVFPDLLVGLAAVTSAATREPSIIGVENLVVFHLLR